MDSLNPKDIIKYMDETATQEEKKFLDSPEGQKKYKEFETMWNKTQKELKNV